MKKWFLLILAMLLVGSAAQAKWPYAYLAGDTVGGTNGANRICHVLGVPPYTEIELWVWFLPDPVKGMTAAEFRIVYPPSSDIIQGEVTSNPMAQVELGTLASGMSVSLGESNCQYGWTWTHKQILVLRTWTPLWIRLAGHPVNGGYIYVASCEPGFPVYRCTPFSNFAINQACVYGTRDASWGAIKSLYRE